MSVEFCKFEKTEQKLTYTLQSQDVLDMISVEMIRRNQREMHCLLPIRFVTENGYIHALEYDISFMKTLEEYLKHFAINKKRFAEIAVTVLDHLERCSYYMLPYTQISIQIGDIYLDPATMSIALLCFPLKNQEQEMNLRSFFMDLLEHVYLDVNSFDENGDFQKLYDTISEQKADILTIREDLNLFLGETGDAAGKQNTTPDSRREHMITRNGEQYEVRQDLVEVAQAVPQIPVQSAVSGSGTQGKLRIPSLKLFSKAHGEESAKPSGGGLMAQLRKAQGGTTDGVSTQIPGSVPQVGNISYHPQTSSHNSGTILILHDEPDTKAFLICKNRKLQIDPEGIGIGRLHGVTQEKVGIFFDSVHVSAYHALLSYDFEHDYYTVTDFSSTGIRKNGVRIPKGVPVQLEHNDALTFGDVPCRIVLETDAEKQGGTYGSTV
ncbi:DUF6382 domain-containing protein [Ruminococcus sp.]|uniref:DUF6382 domain-containing protein n=1 Tax=Ruminococcus sp. TaxID=41978 RepID=UPI0025E89420|nr:DUF6382 domain-containing protein [Ruminococcus sp.]